MLPLRLIFLTLMTNLLFSYALLADATPSRVKADSGTAFAGKVSPTNEGPSTGRSSSLQTPKESLQEGSVKNVNTGQYFSSLKSAIDDPSTEAGQTLEIVARELSTGTITIDKSITLRGYTGKEVIRMDVDTDSRGDGRAWFLVEAGVDVHVQDLTFDGRDHRIYQAFLHKGTGRFENCTFRNIRFSPYQGTALAITGGKVDVKGCHFERIGRRGILVSGPGVSGTLLEDNTYLGKGDGDHLDYGFEVGGGAVVTLAGNRASSCRGVAKDNSHSAGFLFSTFPPDAAAPDKPQHTVVTARRNTATESTYGLFAYQYREEDSLIVEAGFNRISGNKKGFGQQTPGETAENSGSLAVTAQNNWWGSNDGPVGTSCSDEKSCTDFDPWLELDLSAKPQIAAVRGDIELLASLTRNSDARFTPPEGYAPDGIDVTFYVSGKKVATASTTRGRARTKLVVDVPSGEEEVFTVRVDDQLRSIRVPVVDQPAVSLARGVEARPDSFVQVPIEFNGAGKDIAAVAFSIEFDDDCLRLDDVSNDFAFVKSLDRSFPDPLPPSGMIYPLRFQTLCNPGPGKVHVAHLRFSSLPKPSFGSSSGRSIPGISFDGSIRILGTSERAQKSPTTASAGTASTTKETAASNRSAGKTLRMSPGQLVFCGNLDREDSGDIVACEIFDGDGVSWKKTPGGDFRGDPLGCDINRDQLVDAGDIICHKLIGAGRPCPGSRRAKPCRVP